MLNSKRKNPFWKRLEVRVVAGLLAVAAGLGGVAYYYAKPPQAPADSPNPAHLAMGRAVYSKHCAGCHGERLQGQPNWKTRLQNGRMPAPPHDDTGHTWHHPDSVLFGIVKQGLVPPYGPPGYQSDMPAFQAVLADEEIRAALAFIKSRWSSQIHEWRAQTLKD